MRRYFGDNPEVFEIRNTKKHIDFMARTPMFQKTEVWEKYPAFGFGKYGF
ncbi:hypothetical protein [Cypionkella psychrotolerans]|nr:hypothetical protein [Cypionkella psychrotolerans]